MFTEVDYTPEICPCCNKLTLLTETEMISRRKQKFCEHGCTTHEIDKAVWKQQREEKRKNKAANLAEYNSEALFFEAQNPPGTTFGWLEEKFFENLTEALDYQIDDSLSDEGLDTTYIPEFAELCDEILPELDASWIVSRITENHPTHDEGEQTFCERVTEPQITELQLFLNGWIEKVGYKQWQPNGKFIEFRKLLIEHVEKNYTLETN